MDDDVETIKQKILREIRPINFGDELNIDAILGEELFENLSPDEPAAVKTSKETISSPLKRTEEIVCHVCRKIFSTSRNFKKHFTKHTGQFSCPTCKKIFTRRETQQKHILRCRVIDGQIEKRKRKTSKNKTESYKYHCDECNKGFTRRENYDQHVMIHNGVRVICDFCQKKLSSFKSFQRHRKLHENPQQKISCQDCPSKFSLKSNLQRHIKFQQHKNEKLCSKCNAVVKTEHIWQKHQLQGTISACCLCSQLFCLEVDLRSHLKHNHPNLWFKCKQCTNIKRPFMTRAVIHLQEHVKKLHSVHLDSSDCFQEGWFMVLSS